MRPVPQDCLWTPSTSEFLCSLACKPSLQGSEIWVEKSGKIAGRQTDTRRNVVWAGVGSLTVPKTRFLFKVFFIETFLFQ